MAEAVFRCFFPGRVRLFGKTNGHPWESRATNAAGKNALSQRRNKAERNCRHTQGTQQIKSRSCRTVFLCGSFCFSVLICTPNTGCPVLGVHISYVPDADVFLLLYSFYRFTLHAAFRAIGRLVLEAIPTREATAAAQFKIIALATKVHRLSNHLLSFFYQSRL